MEDTHACKWRSEKQFAAALAWELTCLEIGYGRVVAQVPHVPNFAGINAQELNGCCMVHID
jgi:hypothetical protein